VNARHRPLTLIEALRHVMSLRVFLGMMIVATEIFFLEQFAAAGIEFVLSSSMVTFALLLQLGYGLQENAETPADIVVFIFNWLFLDLAPKIQLLSMPQRLVNTSSVAADRVAMTNLVCALFILAFTGFYRFMAARPENAKNSAKYSAKYSAKNHARNDKAAVTPAQPPREITSLAVGITVFLCIAVVAVAAPSAYHSADAPVVSPATLIVKRFLLFLPSATLLILLNQTVRSRGRWMFTRFAVLFLLVLLVLVTENPRTEKRNGLGPIYIGIILIVFQDWFRTRTRRLLLLVGSMVLVFPASSILTKAGDQSYGEISFGKFWYEIQDHYFSINYDSWANIYTAIEIVKVHGMQLGHQLLGSLLFFVPSSLWTEKPLATGIFLADYLIANYGMWFTNLSAPLIAEGYLDFGYVGVIAYAAVLAGFITLLNKVAARRDKNEAYPMAIYASVFLMIVLRGSLMIALGFAAAAFLSFRLASALLSMNLEMRRRSVGSASRPMVENVR
jgi:hypothetical protein